MEKMGLVLAAIIKHYLSSLDRCEPIIWPVSVMILNPSGLILFDCNIVDQELQTKDSRVNKDIEFAFPLTFVVEDAVKKHHGITIEEDGSLVFESNGTTIKMQDNTYATLFRDAFGAQNTNA